MAFLDDNNILVLEKDRQVRFVVNGILQEQPILQIPVSTESERGLLGLLFQMVVAVVQMI